MTPNQQLDTSRLKPRIKLSLRMSHARVNAIIDQLAKTYSSVNDVAPDPRKLMPSKEGAKYTHKEGTMAPMAFHLGVNRNSYWFTALIESIEIVDIHRVTTVVQLRLTGIKGIGVVPGGCIKNRRCPAPKEVGALETEYVWSGDLYGDRTTYGVLKKLKKRGVVFAGVEPEQVNGLKANQRTPVHPGELNVAVPLGAHMHPVKGNVDFASLYQAGDKHVIHLGHDRVQDTKVPVVVNLDALQDLVQHANDAKALAQKWVNQFQWYHEIEMGQYNPADPLGLDERLLVEELGSIMAGQAARVGPTVETMVMHLVRRLAATQQNYRELSKKVVAAQSALNGQGE